MVVTPSGMVTEVRSVQPKNESSPMAIMDGGKVVFLQPVIKVLLSVSIIALQLFRESYAGLPSATEIEVRPLQLEKTPPPMLVTPLGMITEVRAVQP